MTEVTVEYGKGMRLTSKCEGFSQEIITDAPKIIGGKEEYISPTDLLGMSLGACVLTMMGMAAEQGKIDFSGAKVKVNKTFVGAKIGSLKVDVYYDGDLDEKQIARLEKAAQSCPVHHVIGSDIEHTIAFHFGTNSSL
jgi:putative redox protein